MQTKLFLLSALAAFCLGATSCDKDDNPKGGGGKTENPGGEGVTINGITWATCNVGTQGTFTTYPEDYGNYYTFEEAQEACPEGWRVPTNEEYISLYTVGNELTAENGVGGRRFGSGENTIFLPAAGYRNQYGTVARQGSYGHYWSSTARGGSSGYNLFFNSEYVNPSNHTNYAHGFSVRCVAE
jgi:uncharacterized protein (TIGR02145 family)